MAIALVSLTGGIILTFLYARGPLAGADALAYWAGVRSWLAGGDAYHAVAPFLPYVYAPWTLPLFVPWALLPWDVAWFLWRAVNVLLFLWSAEWAYRRHPLGTAVLIALLALPLAATLDTGNITLILALMVWAAYFTGPRLGGALYAFAAALKWFPVFLLVFLPPRARLWGVVGLGVAALLTLATWPQTLVQLTVALSLPRPPRLDLLLLLWGAVPWLWLQPRPIRWLQRTYLSGRVSALRDGLRSSGAAARRAGVGTRVRSFFGLAAE